MSFWYGRNTNKPISFLRRWQDLVDAISNRALYFCSWIGVGLLIVVCCCFQKAWEAVRSRMALRIFWGNPLGLHPVAAPFKKIVLCKHTHHLPFLCGVCQWHHFDLPHWEIHAGSPPPSAAGIYNLHLDLRKYKHDSKLQKLIKIFYWSVQSSKSHVGRAPRCSARFERATKS